MGGGGGGGVGGGWEENSPGGGGGWVKKISRRVSSKLSMWRWDRVSGVLDWMSISCQGGSCSRSSGGRIV